jgi:[protein-PII] uridylyltransferase
MPDNYFRASEVPDIVKHLKLFRSFLENATAGDHPLRPAVSWEAFPEQGHTLASFCTWDRHQLLAKIAGSFSVVPLNILGADIYTREDHSVLDVFRVCDTKGRAVTDERKFALLESTLSRALEEPEFDFAPLMETARRQIRSHTGQDLEFPTSIAIDNKAHPAYTLVQIQTPDRLGLLYDLLSCLGAKGISIVFSRISTQNGAAIDTFYVTDSETHAKITDSHRIGTLQKDLQQAAVTGLD